MKQFMLVAGISTVILLNVDCKGPAGPAGPPGPPGTGLDDLTNPAVLPRVLSTFPLAGSSGPYEGFESSPAIEVRFNKIMNRTLIKRSVSLSSSLSDVRADTNNVYTLGGDIFRIYPIDSLGTYYFRWKVGQVYVFSISSSARDVNGNFLSPPFNMAFTPEPYFRVRSVYPQNGAANVPTYTSLSLSLNSPVDTSFFSSILIAPAIEGQWQFLNYFPIDSSYLYFSTFERLSNNTTYTITVDAAARDKHGNQLGQQFTSMFTTAQFRISSTYPSDGSINVFLNNPISVYLTGSIDTGTVRSAFSISPPVTGYFSMYYESSNFTFSPTNGFAPSTQYTVTVSTGLQSESGVALSAPYSFSFTTAPFQVTGAYPSNGQSGVSRNVSIYVYCSGNLDTTSIRSAFGISPSVAGSLSFYAPSSYFYFFPSSLLAANQIYTVTISTALRSRGGSNLASPNTFSFTTGN